MLVWWSLGGEVWAQVQALWSPCCVLWQDTYCKSHIASLYPGVYEFNAGDNPAMD